MGVSDQRETHLGWVETSLRVGNPDLAGLRLVGQSHYSSTGFAFIEVWGCEDTERRRGIRRAASDLLRNLGYVVELEPGRDIFDFQPDRPASRHEQISMLHELRCAVRGLDGPQGG